MSSALTEEKYVPHQRGKGGTMINHTTIKILKYNAESLRNDPKYAAYVKIVLKDLKIKDAEEAFVFGAVDAMINGATTMMNGTGVLKKALLKAIAKNDLRMHRIT